MRNSILLIIISVYFSEILTAQEPYYSDFYLNWHEDKMQPDSVDHILYLIGDAGEVDFSKPSAIKLLSAHLKEEENKSTVVFLGDNIYPKCLPEVGDPERENAVKNLETQIEINKNHKGEIYFIPGNHDWDMMRKKGREAIKREEEYVENALNSGNTFLPDNSCPGPVEVPLSEDVLLVIIDTQWWLHKWDKPYGDEDSCKSRNEFEFIEKLEKIAEDNEDKQIVLAGHHPFYSHGYHGGHFTIIDHIFSITKLNKNYLFPLPVIGSIYPLYRKYISPLQDINHPRYQLLKNEVLGAFKYHKNFIYAAGHEHSLQYYNRNNQHFIVSGSGSKTKYVAKRRGADFNISKQGFAKVIYMKSGETWIEYWTVSEDNFDEGILIFTKKVKASDNDINFKNEERLDFSDSTITIAANKNFKIGKIKQAFLGKHHRDAWTTPIEVKVFDMAAFEGGLSPIKMGGGMQTKSLRLEDKTGTQYIFRSVNKDPTKKFLADELQNTWVSSFMKDQVSMSHPYGAIVVPDLADSAGILHKKTRLVYIPDDPLLGEFRDQYKNTLAMLEVRASKNLKEYDRFDNVKEAINTPDLIDELHDDNRNVVDEFDMLKNRLFDMIIGDFDRHDDQWRWAETECRMDNHSRCFHIKDEKNGSGNVYRAIPRDRDQVFDHVDGLIPRILTLKWGPARLLRNFDFEIKDLVGLNLNGRQLDKTFLSSLNKQEWIDMATELKNSISDETIEQAVRTFPKEIYDIRGEEIVAKLKQRRDDIVKYAEAYYLILAEKVNITGSDERELFEVHRKANGNTVVKVYRKDRDHSLLFKREFIAEETKEIRLYALGADDKVQVFGNVKNGMIIRIVGGSGDDEIKDFLP